MFSRVSYSYFQRDYHELLRKKNQQKIYSLKSKKSSIHLCRVFCIEHKTPWIQTALTVSTFHSPNKKATNGFLSELDFLCFLDCLPLSQQLRAYVLFKRDASAHDNCGNVGAWF